MYVSFLYTYTPKLAHNVYFNILNMKTQELYESAIEFLKQLVENKSKSAIKHQIKVIKELNDQVIQEITEN